MATESISAILSISSTIDESLWSNISAVQKAVSSMGSSIREVIDLNSKKTIADNTDNIILLNQGLATGPSYLEKLSTAQRTFTADLDKSGVSSELMSDCLSELIEKNEKLGSVFKVNASLAQTVSASDDAAETSSSGLSDKLEQLGTTSKKVISGFKSLFDSANSVSTGFFNAATQAADTAAELGMSSQELQALQYAGECAGISADSMSTHLGALNARLAEASSGAGDAAGVFGELGLDAASMQLMSTEERVLTLSEAFKTYSGQLNKAGMANKLFGKGGSKMTAFMNLGADRIKSSEAEGRQSGYVISPEKQDAAQNYAAAKGRLNAKLTGFQNKIGASLLPVNTALNNFAADHAGIVKAANIGYEAVQFAGVIDDTITFGNELNGLYKKLKHLGSAKTELGGLTIGKSGGVIRETLSLGNAAGKTSKAVKGLGASQALLGALSLGKSGEAVSDALQLGKAASTAGKALKGLGTASSLLGALSIGESGGAASIGMLSMLGEVADLIIPGISSLATTVMPLLSGAIEAIGISIGATPIGWIVAGIAAAAVLIIKFWQPIKAFFVGVGQGMMEALQPVMPVLDWMGSLVATLFSWLGKLFKPIQFSTEALGKCTSAGQSFGKNMMYFLCPVLGMFKAISWGVKKLKSFFGKDDKEASAATVAPEDTAPQFEAVTRDSDGKPAVAESYIKPVMPKEETPLLEPVMSTEETPSLEPVMSTEETPSLEPVMSTVETPSLVAQESSYTNDLGSSVMTERNIPNVKPETGGKRPVTVNQNNEIKINLQTHPGQDAKELARSIADEIEARKATFARAALYDNPAVSFAY